MTKNYLFQVFIAKLMELAEFGVQLQYISS